MACLWYMQQAQARWHAGLFTSDDDAKRKSSPAGNPHQTFFIRSMEKPEILLEKEKQKRTDEAGTLPLFYNGRKDFAFVLVSIFLLNHTNTENFFTLTCMI